MLHASAAVFLLIVAVSTVAGADVWWTRQRRRRRVEEAMASAREALALLEAGAVREAEPLLRVALVLAEESLDARDPQLLPLCVALALAAERRDRLDEAVAWRQRILEIAIAVCGPRDPRTGDAHADLGAVLVRLPDPHARLRAREHLELALGIAHRAEATEPLDRTGILAGRARSEHLASRPARLADRARRRRALALLAALALDEERYDAAEEMAREALGEEEEERAAAGARGSGTNVQLSNDALDIALRVALAEVHVHAGRLDGAEAILRVLAAPRAEMGGPGASFARKEGPRAEGGPYRTADEDAPGVAPDDPQRGAVLAALARVLAVRGRFAEAEVVGRRALARVERTSTAGSAASEAVISPLWVLAVCARERARFSEAAPLLARAVEIATRAGGPDHATTLALRVELATVRRLAGQLDVAAALVTDVLRRVESMLPRRPSVVADALLAAAEVHRARGMGEAAERLYRRALDVAQAAGDRLRAPAAQLGLARLEIDAGSVEPARYRAARAREEAAALIGADHPLVHRLGAALAEALARLGRVVEARAVAGEAVAALAPALGSSHPELIALGVLLAEVQAATVTRRPDRGSS